MNSGLELKCWFPSFELLRWMLQIPILVLLDSCNKNWFLVFFFFGIFSMLFKLFISISVVLRAWILNKIHHWIDLLCFSFPFYPCYDWLNHICLYSWWNFEITLNVMCFLLKNNCRLWPYITPLYSTRWLEISNISII